MQHELHFRQVWTKTRTYIPQVILYTFFAGLAVAVMLAIGTTKDAESERKLAQLRQMVAETQLLPGFQKQRASEYNKHGSAMIIVNYYAPARYDEVKAFHSQLLVAKGWSTPVEESFGSLLGGAEKKSITFRSGEFSIKIAQGEPSMMTFIYLWEEY